MPTYMPTILIVEDDPAMNAYLRERFHSETSVGVVAAETLTDAKRLIDAHQIRISAVVSDLFFDEAKTDVVNHLNDSLDFLSYCKEWRPEVPQYIFSVFSDKDSERAKANELDLPIRTWFQKLWYRPGAGGAQAPWACVERDLIEQTIRSGDQSLKERLRELGHALPDISPEIVSETVRSLNIARRTYIQFIDNATYRIAQPIEVICVLETDGTVRAHAPRFALINDGGGDTIEEALADLAVRITAVKEALDEEPKEALHDYLRQYRDALDSFIHRKNGR